MEEWIKVKNYFVNNPKVFVASIDCTRHRTYCQKYDALKFPRIRFIHNSQNGNQIVIPYDGEKNSNDMIEYCEQSVKMYD